MMEIEEESQQYSQDLAPRNRAREAEDSVERWETRDSHVVAPGLFYVAMLIERGLTEEL